MIEKKKTSDTPQKTFRDLGIADELADALEDKGITHPFPIQELTLPMALKGADIIGQARTGTGKTLGFGLPLLHRIDTSKKQTQALIIVPTRELCVQVADDLSIGSRKGITSIAVYGGVPIEPQTEKLTNGVHVVVGTPGRLLDHLNRGNLDLSEVTELVLDEADEMLDMGFLPDVERLIEASNGEGRHTMLFSATMPSSIVSLARRYMSHPTFMRAEMEESDVAPTVDQHFFLVHRMDKPRVLARILQSPDRGGVYVFTRTKNMADRLVKELEELNVAAIAIHGDLRQTTRQKNLDTFREGKADVLVATEVAARGLDVEGVTHVVNYDCPDDDKMYLHRIGRTARAGAKGVAVTFAQFNEVDRLNVIRKAVDATEHEVEEVFSTSDRLQELFDLPDETPWAHLSKKVSRAKKSDDKPSSKDSSSKRSGSSDGRSKNKRSSEGRGEERSSRRDRPEKQDERSRDDARKSDRSRDESKGSSRKRDESKGSDRKRDEAETSDRKRDDSRSRDRSRGRDDRAKGDDDKRDDARTAKADDEGGRTRTRTRTRSRSESSDRSSRSSESKRDEKPASKKDESEKDERDTKSSSSGRTRARARRSSGDTKKDPSSEKAGDNGRSRSRSSKDDRSSDDRKGGRGKSESRSRDESKKGRSSDRKSNGKRDDDRRGGRSGGSKDSGRSSGGGADIARRLRGQDEKPTKRGDDARGDGAPSFARRVKVEHLP